MYNMMRETRRKQVRFVGIPTNIKTLLFGSVVEWARIEFKENWDAASSLKTICAFANDIDNWGGGYIVLGVKAQDGQPVFPLEGLPAGQLDRIQKEIFKGPLHFQMRDALLYIRNSIIQEQIIKLPDIAEAKRFFNYPYAAIEESVA